MADIGEDKMDNFEEVPPQKKAPTQIGEIHVKVFSDAVPEFEFKGNLMGREIDVVMHKISRAYRLWKTAPARGKVLVAFEGNPEPGA